MKTAFRSRALAVLLCAGTALPAFSALATETVTMYKDPNCGCCGKWAEHMRANGFEVKEVASSQMAEIKQTAGLPPKLASCHTAKVGGYVVEGHVPAADVKRLLAEKPAVVGISAPGMPQGSPGMEGPYPADRYEVVSFDRDGRQAVFARH
ncbi:DUF411 domain-containing protein [Azoarcus sp. TTM-91]|uniref:DUF411 domain-containing protein n=1 Tax=Azoarcus sp. TTM-91 TaxID=2691581 RepID=UPI00145F1952|nr:DUF411 domain-containing protein [Azoarcus sp. TTM-91]NMG36435.1 DUF411 domain-containing protein [Azoarcus sp. TTM-91]